ncbi:TPA: hypothetical protein HA238_05830 [Candidatus Micrarchaeota archaeon]|nr:hypothetical protein [Candidatus Micrarchaeota archaeon]
MCAICLGPTVLAKAGLLNGIKATVFRTPDSLRILRDNKAIYANDPVVVDGNIVTAEGPKSAETFGKKIIELLKK